MSIVIDLTSVVIGFILGLLVLAIVILIIFIRNI